MLYYMKHMLDSKYSEQWFYNDMYFIFKCIIFYFVFCVFHHVLVRTIYFNLHF